MFSSEVSLVFLVFCLFVLFVFSTVLPFRPKTKRVVRCCDFSGAERWEDNARKFAREDPEESPMDGGLGGIGLGGWFVHVSWLVVWLLCLLL